MALHYMNKIYKTPIFTLYLILICLLILPIRPLAKLAYAEEFEGDAERRTAAYSSVREDSSTASLSKLPAEVELGKRSIVTVKAESPVKAVTSSAEGNNNITRHPDTNAITLEAKQAIVIDYATGKVLLAKNADEHMFPSSMTKIMTSYLIEEKIQKGEVSFDSHFIVSEKAWRMGGSKSFMPLGEMVRLEDILNGIIVQSGNDACIVAAEGLYGTEENFVEAMNLQAQKIGMKDTHFVNASGWPAENHYSTAYDLAILSMALIKNHPEFYHIYSKKYFTFGKDQKGRPITQGNRNLLLYKDIGCDGIKTGFTDNAGYGMVASCIDDGRRYIMVVNGLSSMKKRADESLMLLDWIKQNFIHKKFYAKGDIIEEINVWLGVKDKVQLVAAEKLSMVVPRSNQEKIDIKISIPPTVSAPLKAGDIVGKITVIVDNDVQEIALLAKESIDKVGFLKRIACYFNYLFFNK
ncbi:MULTISPECIES: palindromic element RPE1 domain-containing protein [unclassified Candidatus Tisiphia]|uniref:palindromic element RPE1 domain-containing protein n=1 Tax=unclassified Candidatus Tisiphia TaxID=2996318 RepID=UPI003CCA9D56